MPASLRGTHLPTGRPVEIRLAGRRSLALRDVERFTAVVFGAGDYRTPTEHRPEPPRLRQGDALALGPLRATVVAILGHPRLVEVQFEHAAAVVWEGIARHGRPIQYAYVQRAAGDLGYVDQHCQPASRVRAAVGGFRSRLGDAPSAIRARGAQFATITHAAGISSTGDAELDARAAASTSRIRFRARRRRSSSRRCTEADGSSRWARLSCARSNMPPVLTGLGAARRRNRHAADHPSSDLRVVDAIVSGLHESRQQPLRTAAGVPGRPRAGDDDRTGGCGRIPGARIRRRGVHLTRRSQILTTCVPRRDPARSSGGDEGNGFTGATEAQRRTEGPVDWSAACEARRQPRCTRARIRAADGPTERFVFASRTSRQAAFRRPIERPPLLRGLRDLRGLKLRSSSVSFVSPVNPFPPHPPLTDVRRLRCREMRATA